MTKDSIILINEAAVVTIFCRVSTTPLAASSPPISLTTVRQFPLKALRTPRLVTILLALV